MKVDQKIKDLIDIKAEKECPKTAISLVSTYIKQLTDHINNIKSLSNDEVNTKIDYLAGCTTIILDHPMDNFEFLRARRCTNGNYQNIDDLSYIKQPNSTFPPIGRLNKAGQSLFYASILVKKNDVGLGVVLSEADAKDLDKFNILRSMQKKSCVIKVRMIGIWDYVRLNVKPYYLPQPTFDYYKAIRTYMVEKFDDKLLRAYELTDRFFADVMSKQGHDALYQITSEISSFMMVEGLCDGILYESVKAKGEPVIALKRETVDVKIEHELAMEVFVNKALGYEYYDYLTLSTAEINHTSGLLTWKP